MLKENLNTFQERMQKYSHHETNEKRSQKRMPNDENRNPNNWDPFTSNSPKNKAHSKPRLAEKPLSPQLDKRPHHDLMFLRDTLSNQTQNKDNSYIRKMKQVLYERSAERETENEEASHSRKLKDITNNRNLFLASNLFGGKTPDRCSANTVGGVLSSRMRPDKSSSKEDLISSKLQVAKSLLSSPQIGLKVKRKNEQDVSSSSINSREKSTSVSRSTKQYRPLSTTPSQTSMKPALEKPEKPLDEAVQQLSSFKNIEAGEGESLSLSSLFELSLDSVRPARVKLLAQTSEFVQTIHERILKDKDPYEIIRAYSNVAQDGQFNLVENLLKNKQAKQLFSRLLKIERWTVVYLFYYTIQNEPKSPEVKFTMKELANLLMTNMVLTVDWICRISGRSHKNLETLFKNIQVPSQVTDLDDASFVDALNTSNRHILMRFSSVSKQLGKDVSTSFGKFVEFIDKWTPAKVFEKAFENFYDTFVSKGVISVSFEENKNSQGIPQPSLKAEINPDDVKESPSQGQSSLNDKQEEEVPSPSLSQSQKTTESRRPSVKPQQAKEDAMEVSTTPKKIISPTRHFEDTPLERKSFGDKLIIQELREAQLESGMNGELDRIEKIDSPCFLFQPDTQKVKCKKVLVPEMRKDRKYTLVLDLDETLIHFEENPDGTSQFLIRPFAQNFLKEMAKHYEIIIFTAALKDYADFILDRLDTEGCISHRLYRHNCSFSENVYQKDLNKLNRDLSRTLIVDNNAENFQLQPENGIYIRSWYNDPNDEALKKLAPLLVGKALPNLRCCQERVL